MPLNKPVSISFGDMVDKDIDEYVHKQLTYLKESLKTLHSTKVEKWRRLYRGIPAEETKNFPWKNASNVIIQLIGQHCDNLRARILGSIYEIMPIFVAQLTGEWDAQQEGEEQRGAIEEFLNLMALEPSELDLYRVESALFDEAIKFGTSFLKYPWETKLEQVCTGLIENKPVFKEKMIYDGPRPEKLRFEDFLVDPNANTLSASIFKAHRIVLKKHQLEERKQFELYDSNAIDTILNSPDRFGDTPAIKEENTAKGIDNKNSDEPQWDVYECWFRYAHDKKVFKIIYTYHYATKTRLKAIYNFYPDNEEPFEMARLGYTEDGIHGYGFCEMLEHYQEEVCTNHNQRCDNRTLANTSIFRVDPDSKLDSIFSIYPNAFIPARKDEFEKVQLGAVYGTSVEEEQLTLQLAADRSGVDPGTAAQGGGGTVNKKGSFSAMGTFSVMQAGNRRTNINITDMRYTHLKIGRAMSNMYAEFGIGERIKYFGERGHYLTKALEAIKSGRICLPIRAATASVNRELEKQNDMLLSQVMQRHHQGIAQILQSLQNPQLAPEMKEYLMGWIGSSNQLMAHILRNFGHDDTSRLLPEAGILKGARQNARRQTAGNAGAVSGAEALVQDSSKAQGETSQLVAPGSTNNI